MRDERWIDVLERARVGIETRRAYLVGELAYEMASSDGEVIGQARGFARFQVLAFQQCREAAGLLRQVREAPFRPSGEDAAELERLVDLGHRLLTESGLGLNRL